jgi:polar amino acid transport system substrate-binding protein
MQKAGLITVRFFVSKAAQFMFYPARCVSIFLFVLSLASCADLPRDPRNTTARVLDSRRLRVGVIENPPWVIRTESEPAGAEAALIRDFATELGATPEWHWGGEEKLLTALKSAELDIVIGGLTISTPWTNRVGLTSEFYKENFDVGVPAAGDKLSGIRGVEVAVGRDRRLAGLVQDKGGVPVETPPAAAVNKQPLAGATWKLQALGLQASGVDLHTDRHVVAVPPGENHFIKRLDEFFSKRREQIPALLQQQPEMDQ